LLDHMGRKAEARETCHVVQNLVQGKPFFEIAAAVDIALAKFALYDDKNLAEADRLLRRGLGLCKKHELPLLAEALLLKDELEHAKHAGTDAAASIPELLDFLHQQIALCPTDKEGYLRFWAFSEARDLREANADVASVAGIFAVFASWEAGIYKIGHAVIHDKILVIDPFTDDSVVVTGSHNLGFKASYSNDENMVIIQKNRAVAEAYAAHVLDVYEHYRWRWKLQQPIRDAFQKLKEANPKAKTADLWKQPSIRSGPRSSRRPGIASCRTTAGRISMSNTGTSSQPRIISGRHSVVWVCPTGHRAIP
jgi:hypothetical protein